MAKVKLSTVLNREGHLDSNIIASSILINELEVCGFVNSCSVLDSVNQTYSGAIESLNSLISKSVPREVVTSNYLCQVVEYATGKEVLQQFNATPIFNSIRLEQVEGSYNLENLYIPSLIHNRLYKQIKARFGTGMIVSQSDINKAKFPKNITESEGKAMYKTKESDILLLDRDGFVKSVAQELLVLCRYVHTISGALCYTKYSLDEVYIEE